MTPVHWGPFAGAFFAFLLAERLIRAWFRKRKISPRRTYYLLSGLQGLCIGLAIAVSLWLEADFVRSLPALLALTSLVLVLLSTGAMLLWGHITARMRRIDVGKFIERKYR